MKAALSLHPGVKVTNLYDDGGRSTRHQRKAATVYIFFNPKEQVKSADPVTYDDNGNVIPLSERFNSANEDIRYSTRLLTKSEYGRSISNWNSRMNGNNFTPRNNGGVLITMGDLLVYTDADGQPEHVLEVLTNDIETNNDIIQRAALLETRGYNDEEQAEVLGRVFTEGSFRFRLPGDGDRIEGSIGRDGGRGTRKVRKAVRGEMSPSRETADGKVKQKSLREDTSDALEIAAEMQTSDGQKMFSLRSFGEDYKTCSRPCTIPCTIRTNI